MHCTTPSALRTGMLAAATQIGVPLESLPALDHRELDSELAQCSHDQVAYEILDRLKVDVQPAQAGVPGPA
jgi:hypothetical protein